jgi:hypothetical protein
MRLHLAALGAVVLIAMPGCGGGDDDAKQRPAAKATASPAADRFDEDALLTVHDNLVTCAQQHDELGLVAHLSGNQAISDTEGAGGGEYDDHHAAPEATTELTGAGAEYVGLRADTRHRRGTSDIDVLIFAAEPDAAKARERLAEEAGGAAEQAGPFVNVTLRAAKGARDALAQCEQGATP